MRKSLLLVVIIAALVLSFIPASARPNFVFVLVDDMQMSLLATMPHVSKLRERGAEFTQFVITTPVCCPSRATFLRGQYAHNHGVLTNGLGFPEFLRLGRESSTIATWLQAEGYTTGLIGKYMNHYPGDAGNHVPPGWNLWFAVAGATAPYYNYDVVHNGKRVHYGTDPRDYSTDVFRREAVRFLKRAPEPFFLLVAPSAPHSSSKPARRHENIFNGLAFPKPPSWNEEDVSDKPSWVRNRPLLGADALDLVTKRFRKQARSLAAVDEMLAALTETLRARGVLERTFIIFASDNGFLLGEHRVFSKDNAYEESINVPFVIAGPGVPRGIRIGALAANIDLAPTVAELAGIKPPSFVDGRSLVGLWRPNGAVSWRSAVLIEHVLAHHPVPSFDALRSKRGIYVEYQNGERERYDFVSDPWQLRSLNGSPPAETVLRLDKLRRCAGAACRTADR